MSRWWLRQKGQVFHMPKQRCKFPQWWNMDRRLIEKIEWHKRCPKKWIKLLKLRGVNCLCHPPLIVKPSVNVEDTIKDISPFFGFMPYLYKKVNCDSLACCPYLYVALLIVKGKKNRQWIINLKIPKKKLCFEADFYFFPSKNNLYLFSFPPIFNFYY